MRAALLNYLDDTVIASDASNGYAAVDLPSGLMCELGHLLTSLQNYIQAKSLHHWVVAKPPGGHVTHWWLYALLDVREQRSQVHFGETDHDEVNPVPHLWLNGKANWIGLGHTLLKRFLRWRMATLFDEYAAVALAEFDGAEYGPEYLSFTTGCRIRNLPVQCAVQSRQCVTQFEDELIEQTHQLRIMTHSCCTRCAHMCTYAHTRTHIADTTCTVLFVVDHSLG